MYACVRVCFMYECPNGLIDSLTSCFICSQMTLNIHAMYCGVFADVINKKKREGERNAPQAVNPRTAGGAHMCPQSVFADSRKMAACSAAKSGIPVY